MQVRVTTLESFRRFRDSVTETFDNEENLIQKITGGFHGNNKTEIGTAFHWMVENFKMGIPDHFLCLDVLGASFSEQQVEMAKNHSKSMFPFIAEVKHSKVFQTKYGELTVSGTTDVLQGETLRDTKTKFTPPVFQEYYNSYQWRIYLSIFGLNRFIYDVFEFEGYKDNLFKNVSSLRLIHHDPFECIRYEKMETEILTLMNDFIEWIEFRNLKQYIQ